MLINISTMKGAVPRLKEHLLPNEIATIAKDCEFENGIITPLPTSDFSEALGRSNVSTLHRYLNSTWLTWTDKVSVINSPIAQDEWQRVYWTGQGRPKVATQAQMGGAYSPSSWFDLGVPTPATAPIVTNVNNATGDQPPAGDLPQYDDEDRLYIQTFVTSTGEEGSESPASIPVVILQPGATVSISLAPFTGQNTYNVTLTRLYRSVTSDGSSSYMLVAELPIAINTYSDSAKTINSAVLETSNYTPPDENMQGLCQMANGICAGYYGNEIMFSEAYLPYAWPENYRSTTEHSIVGIIPIETDLVVLTTGHPYLFSGVTPDMINGSRLKIEQSCVSVDSIVTINGAAIYASPDGLVSIGGGAITLLTAPLMTRKQWQDLNPSSISAWAVEGKYVAMTSTEGFIFDPVSLSFTTLTQTWSVAFNDLILDQLYFVQGSNLYQWKGGQTTVETLYDRVVSNIVEREVSTLMPHVENRVIEQMVPRDIQRTIQKLVLTTVNNVVESDNEVYYPVQIIPSFNSFIWYIAPQWVISGLNQISNFVWSNEYPNNNIELRKKTIIIPEQVWVTTDVTVIESVLVLTSLTIQETVYSSELVTVSELVYSTVPTSYFGTNQTLVWRSKTFLIAFGDMISCGKIKSDFPHLLAMSFYVDDQLVHNIPIGSISHDPFRLPAIRGEKCYVEVTGISQVEQITLSSSMGDLR